MNIAPSLPVVALPGSACQQSAHEAVFVAFHKKHAGILFRRLISGFWVYDHQHQRRYRRGVDRFLAEDICQQVWMEMWARLVAGRALSAVTLYQRADARLTDHFRIVRRFRQLEESQLHTASGISRDDRMDLDKAIERLALKDRRIVRSWIDGHTSQEIAVEHGVHPNTVTNVLRRITNMKNETLTASTTKTTTQKVLSALPGTPAEVAKKAGITREAAKKQLQRLQKATKVVSIDGIYSLAIAPTDNSALVSRLQEFAERLVQHKVRISIERFDDNATDENQLPTREATELPTRDAKQIRGAA